MPPRVFAILILSVIAAAGATIALVAWLDLPIALLSIAALLASLILGWKRWQR